VARECTHYLNDYDTQQLIANNYLRLKLYEQAEQHYKNALAMCPNRFIPLSKLMDIYQLTGREEELQSVAKTITEKPVKISSSTVSGIKWKAKKILKNKMNRGP
jgi:tetratricopeptide (TPR) repeat protein